MTISEQEIIDYLEGTGWGKADYTCDMQSVDFYDCDKKGALIDHIWFLSNFCGDNPDSYYILNSRYIAMCHIANALKITLPELYEQIKQFKNA